MDRLSKLINFVYENNDYHRQRIIECGINPNTMNLVEYFHRLPFMQKVDLLDNANLITRGYSRDKLIKERTSGSTGLMLDVYWDQFDRVVSLASIWKIRNRYNIYPESQACYFHTASYRRFHDETDTVALAPVKYNKRKNILSFNKIFLDEKSLKWYYDLLIIHGPKWILAYPSTLVVLVDFLQKNNLKINSVEYIELYGEMLLNSQYQVIKSFFKVPVVNMYGMSEVNGIATSFENDAMTINSENVFVEVLDENNHQVMGREGDIVVTCLNNKAMPIIRYRTGDRGKLLSSNKLELMVAHKNDSIKLISGKKDSALFTYVVEYLNSLFGNIIVQFLVCQKSLNSFDVRLVLRDFCNVEYLEKQFIKTSESLGVIDCTWSFSYEKEYIETGEGKRRYFQSNVV